MPTTVAWYGDDLLKQIREEMPDGLFNGAELLVKTAAARAPKGATGNLRESAYAANSEKSTYRADKRHNKEIKPKQGQAVAAFAMFYASFIEYGTSKKGARPFLRNTMDEMKEQLGGEIVLKMAKRFK